MKKILWILFTIGLIALGYYLLIRPFEFGVNFKANTLPGDVIGTIRIWNRSLNKAEITAVDSLKSLAQTIVWKEQTYNYTWHFNPLNDSVTDVNVEISQPGGGIRNKLLIPFTNLPIEEDADEIVRQFYKVLKTHLEITKVKIQGEVVMDSAFCACSSLETKQIEKANGMMKDFPIVTSFVTQSKLKANGPPMVRVIAWDHGHGLLRFDFCFPIVANDTLPVVKEIAYKKFGRQKALKAVYHGNYITSDRAWYVLMNYATKNGYEVTGMPVEYFYNNPNTGMNEKEWKAEIFLPIKDQ
jgi:effector-binding domain-containing protein